MKFLALGMCMVSIMAVGQTSHPSYFHGTASNEEIELFRVSLAVANRICLADTHATPYIPLPKWTQVPCSALAGVMKRHSTFPDFIDEMHADQKARQAAIDELQKHVNEYLSHLPAK